MEKYPKTPSSSSSKPDRKTIEKNRRDQMKNLFTHLNSLLPHRQGSTSRENMCLPEQIDEATKYIQKLQAQLERLEVKRSGLENAAAGGMRSDIHRACAGRGLKPPRVEIHLAGDSALQLVLITGADCHFIFIEAIRVLHEEGAEVVNASFSVMDKSTVYHTIHAKIQECSQRQAAIARINERLNRFCN